jgi:hypothetical protein
LFWASGLPAAGDADFAIAAIVRRVTHDVCAAMLVVLMMEAALY